MINYITTISSQTQLYRSGIRINVKMEIQSGDHPLERLIEFIEIMERSYPNSDNKDKSSIVRILFQSVIQRDTGSRPASPFIIKPMNTIGVKDVKIYLNIHSKNNILRTLFHLWMSSVKLNTPCFILGKYTGGQNINSAAFILNKVLRMNARMIGIDPTSVPYLVIYDSNNDKDMKLFDKGLKTGFSGHIPLGYFAGDGPGLKKIRKTVMDNRPIGLGVNIEKKRGLDTSEVSEMKIQKFRKIHREQDRKRKYSGKK